MSEQKICIRCLLDTTVSDIWFDENGLCKYCHIHDEMEKSHPLGPSLQKEFENKIEQIKLKGRNRKYDCIVGVSGGRDSSYTLLTAINLGLRPLAVHFDNGWNSDISVQNIKKACDILNVELHTIVADWEEFKDLQISFLKASTPDADVPTDYAIYSVLYHVADRENIRYILNGHSFRTEGTSPISWTYMDPLYVRSVHKKHGKIKKFNSFPHMSFVRLQYYIWIKRIREIRLMEFIDYRKTEVDDILARELGWQYYGGHHHENLYTRFFQSYYLPKKFNIDKRKTELSALVRSGQVSREEAIKELSDSEYEHETKTVSYAINKLGLSEREFDEIMKQPVRSHDDYPTWLPVIRLLRFPIKIAAKLKLVPHILYLKYTS
jgi:N-acetyl sugar amidotransferase